MKLIDYKRVIIVISGAAALLVTGCGGQKSPRAVDYPYYFATSISGSKTDVVRVECTDSAVSLTLRTKFIPGFWFKWSKNTVIYADGTAYPAIGSEDIVLGKKKTVGESGECFYTLKFQPVPASTKTIDLSEGFGEGAFNIWGIDLTGKAKPVQNPLIPKPAKVNALPDFDEGIANSTIRIHLLGYNPNMPDRITLLTSQAFVPMSETGAKVNEEGVAEFNFKQYGTTYYHIMWNGNSACSGSIAPGETLDVYYDLAASGLEMMSDIRPDFVKPDIRLHGVQSGKYSFMSSVSLPVSLELYSADFLPDYSNITADGFYDAMISKYRNVLLAADTLGLSDIEKEMTDIRARQELVQGMAMGKFLLANNYRLKTGKAPDFEMPSLEKRHFDRLFSEIDYTDHKLLCLNSNLLTNGLSMLVSEGLLTDGYLYELGKSSILAKEAGNRRFTDDERKEIDAMEWDFLKTGLYALEEDAEQLRNSASNSYQTVEDWPGAKAWMESIIAPHKGKIVMIDLWNTWCAPCRQSISANEPYKDDELSSDDIVWIYIADESSIMTTYLDMIRSIRGIHYMLTASQKKELAKFLDLDGIPFYVLAERDGSFKSRPDLRDHNKFIKELKDRL